MGEEVVGVIPARYRSVRFPGKPLALLRGKPLIQWVWEGARKARRLNRLLVATDDALIAETVRRFGGEAVMTPPHLPSGTDRVWAAVRGTKARIAVNIQGDEPLVRPAMVDRLVEALQRRPQAGMATLRYRMKGPKDYTNPNVVKVITDEKGWALYFSRSPVPHFRKAKTDFIWYKHLGLYAYRRPVLERFIQWLPSALERAEQLEQLRALEHGVKMQVVDSPAHTVGVDTPEDLERVERLLKDA